MPNVLIHFVLINSGCSLENRADRFEVHGFNIGATGLAES